MTNALNISTEVTEIADPLFIFKALGREAFGRYEGERLPLKVFRLPACHWVSDRVMVSDALVLDGDPLTRKINPGFHEPLLVVATVEDEECVAFAILKFSESPVVKWEPAVPEGADPKELEEGEAFGYGVDFGIGCFCDPALREFIDGENLREDFLGKLSDALGESAHRSWRLACVNTKQGGLALFSTGFGDGCYVSYFGLDATGKAVVLMTDFGVVEWPRSETSSNS